MCIEILKSTNNFNYVEKSLNKYIVIKACGCIGRVVGWGMTLGNSDREVGLERCFQEKCIICRQADRVEMRHQCILNSR